MNSLGLSGFSNLPPRLPRAATISHSAHTGTTSVPVPSAGVHRSLPSLFRADSRAPLSCVPTSQVALAVMLATSGWVTQASRGSISWPCRGAGLLPGWGAGVSSLSPSGPITALLPSPGTQRKPACLPTMTQGGGPAPTPSTAFSLSCRILPGTGGEAGRGGGPVNAAHEEGGVLLTLS